MMKRFKDKEAGKFGAGAYRRTLRFCSECIFCLHTGPRLVNKQRKTFFSIRIIGSAEALPILCVRYFWWERDREREIQRERDGSDVTIVALKLAMNLHFPLPNIRTIGDELTLSLAENSHFSFLPSHFPSLPSRDLGFLRGHHCGAEFRNEFTLSIAKFFFVLFVPRRVFQMARAARRVIENPRQMIKSCPVLFCSSHRKNESN